VTQSNNAAPLLSIFFSLDFELLGNTHTELNANSITRTKFVLIIFFGIIFFWGGLESSNNKPMICIPHSTQFIFLLELLYQMLSKENLQQILRMPQYGTLDGIHNAASKLLQHSNLAHRKDNTAVVPKSK